jgi:hypothetical protein
LAAVSVAPVLADSNAFSINLFNGMTPAQIVSVILVFVIFNFYVVLITAALVTFYLTARPRHGRVRTAAIWHFVATLLILVAFISTVWGAPAEKTFIGSDTHSLGIAQRAVMIFVGFAFAAAGIFFMLIGFAQGARQKRELREEAYAAS